MKINSEFACAPVCRHRHLWICISRFCLQKGCGTRAKVTSTPTPQMLVSKALYPLGTKAPLRERLSLCYGKNVQDELRTFIVSEIEGLLKA